MTASADGASPDQGRDEAWDETVLVWNATVARIRAPGVQPDSARDVADGEGGNDKSPGER